MEKKQTPEEIITRKYEKFIRPIILKYQAEHSFRLKNTENAISGLLQRANPTPKTIATIFAVTALMTILYNYVPFLFILLCILSPFIFIIGFILSIIKSCKKLNDPQTALTEDFKTKIKEEIMPVFCSLFKDLHWQNKKNIDTAIYKKSHVICNSLGSDIIVDDVFYGTHKDCEFEIVEAMPTAEILPSKDSKSDYFSKNILIKLQFKKNFLGHTLIYPKNRISSAKLNKTELEDVMFEKNFDIYTNNEVEARYIITPKLMQKLNSIMQKFNRNDISLSFYYNSFILCVPTIKSDLFSIGLEEKNIDDPKIYVKLFNEIIEVYELIDYFKKL